MQFRTIHAKYPGICNRCNGPIAVGQSIRYGGPRRLYHLAHDCPAGRPAPQPDTADDSPTDDQIFMSAAIAGNIRQDFLGLLDRPAQLADPYAEPEPEPTPEPLTFTTIASATVTTAPARSICQNQMPPAAVPVRQMAGRTPQATRSATIATARTRQPIDPNDLF